MSTRQQLSVHFLEVLNFIPLFMKVTGFKHNFKKHKMFVSTYKSKRLGSMSSITIPFRYTNLESVFQIIL